MKINLPSSRNGYLLPSATWLRQGNVFTDVCHSVHGEGGVWQTPCGQTHPPGQTPPGRHPPSRRLLQRTVRIILECILVLYCKLIGEQQRSYSRWLILMNEWMYPNKLVFSFSAFQKQIFGIQGLDCATIYRKTWGYHFQEVILGSSSWKGKTWNQ